LRQSWRSWDVAHCNSKPIFTKRIKANDLISVGYSYFAPGGIIGPFSGSPGDGARASIDRVFDLSGIRE
jgi:hypothetical protein